MKRATLAIGAGSFVAFVVACGALARCSSSSLQAKRRAILPDQTWYGHYHSTYWRVSRGEAQRADAGVRDFLLANDGPLAAKFDGYYGQILGTGAFSRRLVHLNYFCPDALDHESSSHLDQLRSLVESPMWRRVLIEAQDGGDCFFSIDFDPATGLYENFRVNGDA